MDPCAYLPKRSRYAPANAMFSPNSQYVANIYIVVVVVVVVVVIILHSFFHVTCEIIPFFLA